MSLQTTAAAAASRRTGSDGDGSDGENRRRWRFLWKRKPLPPPQDYSRLDGMASPLLAARRRRPRSGEGGRLVRPSLSSSSSSSSFADRNRGRIAVGVVRDADASAKVSLLGATAAAVGVGSGTSARHRSPSFGNQNSNYNTMTIDVAPPQPPPPTAEGGTIDVNGGSTSSVAANSSSLHRHLSLLDLVLVGVGCTLGSGIFALAGLVARRHAGPSSVLSWAFAGFAACLSGCCYAELASRIPLPGSAYAYSYVAIGEYAAVVSATCLSLEYVFASSAVARSWGDKVAVWLVQQQRHWQLTSTQDADNDNNWLIRIADVSASSWFNPLAFLMATSTVLLLLSGVKESKRATNFFTALKIGVVAFMIVVSSFHVRPENWTSRPSFFLHGLPGVFRGATTTFFGYLVRIVLCFVVSAAPPAFALSSSHASNYTGFRYLLCT